MSGPTPSGCPQLAQRNGPCRTPLRVPMPCGFYVSHFAGLERPRHSTLGTPSDDPTPGRESIHPVE